MNVPFAVLRHASTDWNVERRLQGLTDTPLNAAGEADAAPPSCCSRRRLSPSTRRCAR
jgi:bisphosphoglycerate-dependent phosphoglycerate mutase